jgi:hypothetical protein
VLLLIIKYPVPRFYFPTYSFILVVAVAGWRAFLNRFSSLRWPRFVLFLFLLGALILQGRTIWLLQHDLRTQTEKDILAMLPDGVVLVHDSYGARFNNHKKGFRALSVNHFSGTKLEEWKGDDKIVFYLSNSIAGNLKKSRNLKKHASLIRTWEKEHSEKTQYLPNQMFFPWLNVWETSSSGPNSFLYLLDLSSLPRSFLDE